MTPEQIQAARVEIEGHKGHLLADYLEMALKEIEERDASFDLRWNADQRAIKRWQEATGKTDTWPDHADLCVWLLEQLDYMRSNADSWSETCQKLEDEKEAQEKFLLHLVDVVWANAMEDGQVPSTDHARTLIAHTRKSFDSDEAESHVLPFSVVMFNEEDGWEQFGVYATQEEADATVRSLLARHDCPTRIADTVRFLRHPKPIMDFKGIEPR